MAAGVRPGSAERLPDDESLFRSLFDADILGVVVADQERVVEANDAFLRIVGATRAELLAGRLTWTRHRLIIARTPTLARDDA